MSGHKAVNCVVLLGENLKMGKDVRGIARGKCACGECEDFMRSDGATSGYYDCLPTCHSKEDARYSSDSIGSTSGAGTSESPENWGGSRTQRGNIQSSQIVFCLLGQDSFLT